MSSKKEELNLLKNIKATCDSFIGKQNNRSTRKALKNELLKLAMAEIKKHSEKNNSNKD